MHTVRHSSPHNDDVQERPAKRRARSAVACQRCKGRKQRCDNEFPSCSNCLCAGEACSYGVKQVYPSEYVRSLENHIAQLEQSLTSVDPKLAADHLANMNEAAAPRSSRASVERRSHDDREENAEPSLELGVGFVALSPNSYLGTSSGFQLAKLVKSAMNVPNLDAHSAGGSRLGMDQVSSARSQQQQGSENSVFAEMPTDEMGEELTSTYLLKVYPKHPFLSKERVHALNKDRANLMSAHQSQSKEGRANRLDYAILHLVYAIGARYLQLADDNSYPSPESHYAAALTEIDIISDVRSLENLEAMLLLSIYQLRSPTGPGVWWMIGTTMRHCLDGGLHRKTNNLSNLVDQRRKRIFWTAYMLERSVARTVGRPYSVSDRDIDVPLPANIEDSYETEEEITAAILQSLANPHQITSLTAAIHIIRIQQLESKISHTVCRVDKPISEISPHKITKLRNALEEWKAAIPYVSHPENEGKLPYSTTDYHMIQYHKALVLLFLPLLPSLSPSHPDFRLFAYSAGQICQMYKRLHNNQSYISFSLLALHANFVAGLALVYCFCLDPTLFDANFSGDIRACSTMLYAISERWPAARKVRNAFESLVSATIEGNHGTTSTSSSSSSSSGRTARISGRNSHGQHALEVQSLLSHHENTDSDRYAENRVQDSVWDSFETVLGDYQINDTWMYDGIIHAMDTFPTEGWSMWGDI
ncbi:uncharacterized protein Z519_04964 [Cladophialophora bantiana CBS 173.52]|uniref:Zn(2)-C6 fungal-type domain-containing protein n=1 Tax=Cladophialophora bantiana (strain ATCC 10958 / CBS 173.52 / CDC B-1940 / NIH 8579) TaxID=1442370 RepID=A0A0D2IDZ4_CLAB1|nr:uncharacterized protein Z519_04964 [Cladophialophora bantiana CBS 173.52]KIW94984.1 hypothetical protein Z519_04964 [Cladophialophora bantiana CBS 173.52]